MKRNYLTLGPFSDMESAFVKAGIMFKFADKELGYYQVGSSKGRFEKNDPNQFAASPTYWLLVGLQEFACRQPIDHVYGLLGLHQQLCEDDELPELLQPGPNKSVRDVFRDATRLTIQEGHNLLPLLAVYRRTGEREDDVVRLPSWVPSWHQSWTPDLDPHPLSRDYAATLGHELNVADQSPVCTDEIGLKGIFVDGTLGASVEDIARNDVVDWKDPSTSAHFDSLEELIRSHSSTKMIANVGKTVARVLCAGKNAATKLATDDDLLGYNELKLSMKSTDGLSSPHELSISSRASQYAAALKRAYHRRKFFITANGRAGLGPATMRTDDVVVVLYGARVPFVLRRVGEKFELIGPCYVDGVMEGQAVKEHEDRGDDDVWFRII